MQYLLIFHIPYFFLKDLKQFDFEENVLKRKALTLTTTKCWTYSQEKIILY